MEARFIKELCDILDLESKEELDDYLSGMNNYRLFLTYDQIKERYNAKRAINLLEIIIKNIGFVVSDEAIELLLQDEDLFSLARNTEETKNSLLIRMDEFLGKSDFESDDEELSEEELEELKKSSDKELKKNPVYEPEEELLVFQQYDYLKMKLELYIYANRYKPEFEEFIDYINNMRIEGRNGKTINYQNKEPFIVRAVWQLYRNTDDPVINNIQKDETVSDIMDKLTVLRDDIMVHNTGWVVAYAKKFRDRGLPLDDLIQEGKIGLLKAINKFEVHRGDKFSTFSTWWIRQAITRLLADEGTTIKLPTHVYEFENRIRPAVTKLRYEQAIDEPTPEQIYEMCQKLNIPNVTLGKIEQLLKNKLISNPASTDKYVGEDEDTSLIEFLVDETYESPEEYTDRNYVLDRFNRILDDMFRKASEVTRYSRDGSIRNSEVYKKIHFNGKNGKRITIILTLKEYDWFLVEGKKLVKERFKEMLSKYNIDPNSLTSKFETSKTTKVITRPKIDGTEVEKEVDAVKISFVTKYGKDIDIVLTSSEYDYYIKNPKKVMKERFRLLIKKYKLTDEIADNNYRVSDLVYTTEARNVLVYRMRKYVLNDEARSFFNGRNYNNALFEEPDSDRTLTLENVGELFGVTRERIRQIENKMERKVNLACHRTFVRETFDRTMYIGEVCNIYEILNVKKEYNYILNEPIDEIVKIDRKGNIVPVEEGTITIRVKDRRDLSIRELTLIIVDMNKEFRNSETFKKILNKKKDNRF